MQAVSSFSFHPKRADCVIEGVTVSFTASITPQFIIAKILKLYVIVIIYGKLMKNTSLDGNSIWFRRCAMTLRTQTIKYIIRELCANVASLSYFVLSLFAVSLTENYTAQQWIVYTQNAFNKSTWYLESARGKETIASKLKCSCSLLREGLGSNPNFLNQRAFALCCLVKRKWINGLLFVVCTQLSWMQLVR